MQKLISLCQAKNQKSNDIYHDHDDVFSYEIKMLQQEQSRKIYLLVLRIPRDESCVANIPHCCRFKREGCNGAATLETCLEVFASLSMCCGTTYTVYLEGIAGHGLSYMVSYIVIYQPRKMRNLPFIIRARLNFEWIRIHHVTYDQPPVFQNQKSRTNSHESIKFYNINMF